MKKIICFLFVIVFVLSFAAGCMRVPEKPEEDYEVDLDIDKNITETITIGITNFEAEEIATEALIEGFNDIFPNVTVNVKKIGGVGFNQQIINMYNADLKNPGIMPDIIYTNSADGLQLIGKDILLNIQPYFDAAQEKGTLNLDDYYENYMKLGQKGYDGDQYIIPRSADHVVVQYNKTMFEAAGVDMSKVKNGWSWQDFLDTLDTLKAHFVQNKDTIGVDTPLEMHLTWEATWNPILVSNGAKVFNDDGSIALDSAETRKALQMIQELDTKGYIGSGGFGSGQAAILVHSQAASIGKAQIEALTYNGKKCEYDVVSFPEIGENPKVGCGVPGYGIYARSQKRDIAWQFLQYVLSKEGQDALTGGGYNSVPVRKDMADPKTNKWGEGMDDVNLEAYTYNMQNDIPTDFHVKYDVSYSYDLISALGNMVYYAISDYTIDEAIEKCVGELKYIIGRPA